MSEDRSPAIARRRVVEASAPCRIDLAGGVLDAWPVYLFHPGAVTVTVALDRRVSCRVETGVDGVEIESKDTLQKLRAGTVAELAARETPVLGACVLQALGIESGLRVITHARVPEGLGLGSSSALAVALTSAVARAVGQDLSPEEVVSLSRDAEVRARALPGGVRGYHAALHGGVLALDLGPGAVRVERALVDPARVEESLVLVDAGPDQASSGAEWDVIKGQLDGEGTIRQSLAAVCSLARQLREALAAGRFEDVVGLMAQEWEIRRRLRPGEMSPALARAVETVRAAGGAAQAGERLVVAWAPPGAREAGRREAVTAALRESGLRLLPVRVDLRGLDVEVEDVA